MRGYCASCPGRGAPSARSSVPVAAACASASALPFKPAPHTRHCKAKDDVSVKLRAARSEPRAPRRHVKLPRRPPRLT